MKKKESNDLNSPSKFPFLIYLVLINYRGLLVIVYLVHTRIFLFIVNKISN